MKHQSREELDQANEVCCVKKVLTQETLEETESSA